ncbi:succinylglutamate desuccinylase/aspartoacylase family protein [Methanonatronarchaeum sp. AMET-Sl]|uniref:succinylglutamate desuccinylase/aspartoacylase family protein n=1 Tax=Methanonatronarchaeum sp. AMET-Sl TaxID=3037654 RepID=UPI00244DD8DE|nr:succinylglutamate desuccinylase/aspartoacylase family protein [Methanonatronarchaeum sp. AMET-Sl]WGI16960.1 succinylglutamate desuccinylase/aspartoacylase family protein [Methanonatronarchaeum sp. AMET-Sl]
MDRTKIQNFNKIKLKGKKKLKIDTFKLADDSVISLPCGVISNGKGPKIAITGGQHGNEWNGTYIAQRLYKEIPNQKTNGTIVILPVLNPPAFNQKNRVSSIDNIDLNRTYLGSDRKPTERIGKLLFENIFSEMDYIIDIHTGGPGEYLPHTVIVDRERVKEASLILPHLYIAKATGGSLVSSAEREGIKSYLIEVGRGRNINYRFVKQVIKGIKNFLKGTNIIKGQVEKQKTETFLNKQKIPSPQSGFFKSKTKLGEFIEKGQTIGKIEKMMGEEKTIKSPISGRVIYIRRERVVAEGENVLHLLY